MQKVQKYLLLLSDVSKKKRYENIYSKNCLSSESQTVRKDISGPHPGQFSLATQSEGLGFMGQKVRQIVISFKSSYML